ncbi:hypothetical protein [Desulfosporosinus lacus]|uniref:Deacetylase PdaC domain-containing protein n=1 Tax=Desulfosporosinus lacus DSM 15449 TaxID=1121420 RepID=A0A1M5ZJM7_9FIRM|nr:hypothetical protein [Desulfosporosinus lacus]SHI24497.1 hypothetical protein SAMN02746098_03353 [Desulfosporosinus lacus DSM 15449]
MKKLKEIAAKTWVIGAGALLILGSSSAMAFALDPNVPESSSAYVVATNTQETTNNFSLETGVTAEYSVIDLSKGSPERDKLIRDKLSLTEDITPEQIEEKFKDIISNSIPGAKDISAEQAAAYAADILKTAYNVDFTSYTAHASFSKNPMPNSDNWTVIFHAPNEDNTTQRYIASVDSVNGSMLDASSFNLSYLVDNSKNPEDPEWKNKAEEDIARLMPEEVSITSSKVIYATPETGVMVVSELSDGSACAVRLTGENKEAATYIFFPNGYDGSLDLKPITENAVG